MPDKNINNNKQESLNLNSVFKYGVDTTTGTLKNGLDSATLKLKFDEYTALMEQIYRNLMEQNYQAAGAGSFESLYPKIMTRFDRFNKRYYTPNTVFSGYTFITRPRLCLTAENLHANRYMQLFNTTRADTIQFAIRCLLDTKFSNPNASTIPTTNIWHCPYFDPRNPFLSILTNTFQDASGFPSQHIESYTSEGGIYSEDIRFAIGSDRNNKSFDVNMTFTDIEGGLVMSLFQLWLTYIDLVTAGECLAYVDDIVHQRLNYTVSIYRFIMDPSNRFIESWSKCTGCYPVDRPGGARFDVSRSERYVEAAKNFTIQFACNKYEENDPIILVEFNTLMQRYNPYIGGSARKLKSVPFSSEFNYVGLPYVILRNYHRPILDFRYLPYNEQNTTTKYIDNINEQVKEAQKVIAPVYNQPIWV